MDEKVLLEWKDANAEVYSKFKQDLEEKLQSPFHQTILDIGDGNAESLHTAIANLAAVTSDEGFDIDILYSKDVETNEDLLRAINRQFKIKSQNSLAEVLGVSQHYINKTLKEQ